MVTKSANDSAMALGEMLGGSEANFARMMTAKARQLGMNGTVFRNPNGLPDPGQFTTARDMAVLGIALRRDFPQYYGYFSTQSFLYNGRRINGHNRLLGRIRGVDGIKTGYTRMSGYNLVSSVSDGNHKLVAVVMGGVSGGARDRQMAALIQKYMPMTSGRKGAEPMVADAAGASPVTALAKVFLPKQDAPTPDDKPVAVAGASSPADPAPAKPAQPKRSRKGAVAEVTVSAPVVEAAYAEPEKVDPVSTASVPSGWAVQVASSPSRAEAQAALDKTLEQARRALGKASGFTVAFDNNGTTYYRARFGGFGSKSAAWNACNALKKKRIECYAIEQ
jgi:D-alanyl-D-alanine carboxypeptidase